METALPARARLPCTTIQPPPPTPDDIRLPFYILGNADGAQAFEGFYEVGPGRVTEFAFLKNKGADTGRPAGGGAVACAHRESDIACCRR